VTTLTKTVYRLQVLQKFKPPKGKSYNSKTNEYKTTLRGFHLATVTNVYRLQISQEFFKCPIVLQSNEIRVVFKKHLHYRLVLKQENTQQFYGLQRLRSFWTEM
jgi:hypothetical protein